MQPPARQFPSKKNGPTSRSTSGQFDALLQFESENRSVRRREHAAVSVRPSSSSPSSLRAQAAVRSQLRVEVPPVARSNGRRSLWAVVVGAVCGSVLTAVMFVLTNAPSPMPSQNPPVSPPVAATPVQTAVPVERPTDATPLVPVTLAGEKKPVARLSVEQRSTVAVAPVASFYGSLAIDSIPVRARAFLDGELLGVTPLVLTGVHVGSRAIRLEIDDHTPWTSTVDVVADQQTRISATLSPSP
jgi:hypothetical protein